MFTKNLKPGEWVIHTPSGNIGKVVENKENVRTEGKLDLAVFYIFEPVPAYADGPENYYYTDEYFDRIPFIDAELVKVYRMPDNNLLMVLTEYGRAVLPNIRRGTETFQWSVEHDLLTNLWEDKGWEYTSNAGENWDQMSSTPAITDPDGWEYLDERDMYGVVPHYFWHDPNYQIIWWVDELEKNGYFVWTYFNAEPDENEQ